MVVVWCTVFEITTEISWEYSNSRILIFNNNNTYHMDISQCSRDNNDISDKHRGKMMVVFVF